MPIEAAQVNPKIPLPGRLDKRKAALLVLDAQPICPTLRFEVRGLKLRVCPQGPYAVHPANIWAGRFLLGKVRNEGTKVSGIVDPAQQSRAAADRRRGESERAKSRGICEVVCSGGVSGSWGRTSSLIKQIGPEGPTFGSWSIGQRQMVWQDTKAVE